MVVKEGGVELVVDLLGRDLAAERLYPADWAVQAQRSAVTLLAVMATHKSLRPDVIEVRFTAPVSRGYLVLTLPGLTCL